MNTAMSPLLLLYSAGLAQAAFLIGALSLLRVRNPTARWLLVALIALFSLMLAEEWLEGAGMPIDLGLGLAIEFALGPLLYFFLRALFDPSPPIVRRMAPHATPLVVAILVLIGLHLSFPGEGVSLSHPDMRATIAAVVLTKIVVFFAYSVASLRLRVPAGASERRRMVLRRLKAVIAVMIAAYALQAASFVAFLLRLPFMPDSDMIGGLILALSLYTIGYFCFLNRDIFDLRDSYRDSPLPPEEAAKIRERAIAYLRLSEAFRDPDFDLRALAEAVRAPPGKLSQALNASGGPGFAALINTCRLDAYRAARADPSNRSRTVLELALDAGFNSKATFYRALRADEARVAGE
jgi:AraC-like DNA-binding protein